MRYAIDPTKLETELGWNQNIHLIQVFLKQLDWYLNNKEWWENIISGEYKNYFQNMYVDKGRVEE